MIQESENNECGYWDYDLHDKSGGWATNGCQTCNIGFTRRRQTKQKHNTIFVGHHHTQTNKKNPSKT
jgi:hypothetical protein